MFKKMIMYIRAAYSAFVMFWVDFAIRMVAKAMRHAAIAKGLDPDARPVVIEDKQPSQDYKDEILARQKATTQRMHDGLGAFWPSKSNAIKNEDNIEKEIKPKKTKKKPAKKSTSKTKRAAKSTPKSKRSKGKKK